MIVDSVAATAAASGKNGKKAAMRHAGMFFCLLLLVSAMGCAPKLYNVDMRYQPTKAISPAVTDGRKYSLTVASFLDNRKMEDTLLIGRVVKSDGSFIPILPKYVKAVDAVAAALRELLIQSGYGVSPEKALWDLQENTIRPEWGTILVGGAIEELDVTCLDTIPRKRYTAKTRVTLVFADVQKKRIFYRVTSESSSTLDHVIFSEEKLESQINSALSEAMEKAIEGSETGRQIREALKP
ncbi:MAG: hypothetical protein JXL20_07535 [Deltaproteobacteria bacterium]|nr:hypothetical protein [Deltaproteobacteria bacterium]